jgi:hypothetical protein
VRSDNASRRQATWYKWSLRWAPKRAVSEKLRRPRSSRIQTLKAQGRAVSEKLRRPRSSRIQTLKAQGRPVSGRQWRKLRKLVRAQGRAAA